jgi:hypothetical protein
VIIQCTVNYILHLQCTFSFSRAYESKGFRRFSVGAGKKEDESSIGRVWPAGFHRATARSCLARVLELMTYFSNFQFFRAAVNSGY